MKFIDYDHNFCEGKINGMPEYLNATTSLIFIGFGLYGLSPKYIGFDKNILHVLQTNNFIINIVYSTFVVIGYGSAGYHWTGQIGWALMDETPMIVCLFLGISYLYQTYKLLNIKNKTTGGLRHIVILSGMFFFIVINAMENYRNMFPYFFTGSVVSFYLLLRQTMLTFDLAYSMDITKKINNNVAIAIFGGTVWYFTELYCNHSRNKLLLLGHPLWHMVISYSFYNIIQLIYFMNCHAKIKLLFNDSIWNDIGGITIIYNRFYLLYIVSSKSSTSLLDQTA